MNATLLFDLEELADVQEFSPIQGSAIGGFVLDSSLREIRHPGSEFRTLDALREDDEGIEQYVELILSLTGTSHEVLPDTDLQVIPLEYRYWDKWKWGERKRVLALYAPENVNLRYIFEDHPKFQRGVYLRGANFRGSKLEGDFTRAQLQGADFTGATISGTFTLSKLQEANFSDTVILDDVSFAEANLQGADFRGAQMGNVNFKYADLTDADLRDIKIHYHTNDLHLTPSLIRANLSGTKFNMSRHQVMREFRPFNSDFYLRAEDDAMLDKAIFIPPPNMSEWAKLSTKK